MRRCPRPIAVCLAAISFIVTAPGNTEERYPSRPIRLVVASAPGGVHDVIARLWAEGLRATLGTIVIDNRGGGGGIIGIVEAARGTPDGYTLLLGSNSTHILIPLIAKQPGFDPLKDFDLATIFSITSTAIAVAPATPYRTLPDLIAAAKKAPGKLSYAHAGTGAISHVAGEMFKQLAGGLDILPVPYKGMGPAQTDVVNGTVTMFVPNVTGAVIGLHDAGRIRILAVNARERHPGLAAVPTAIEAGVPAMITQNFFGIYAPAGTPRALIEQIDAATQRALADPAFRKRLSQAAFDPVAGLGPEQARAFMAEELARWKGVVDAAGIRN